MPRMILRRSLCYHFILLMVLAFSPAFAKDATSEKLQKVEIELNQQKQQAEALDQKSETAAEGLKALQQKLITATASLQTKEAQQSQLEDTLAGLEDEITAKTDNLKANRKQLIVMTTALIKLNRQPPEVVLFRANLTAEHIHRAILLRALLPYLHEEAEIATHNLAALEELREQATEQRRLVLAAQQNLEWQQHNLDQMIKTRQGLLQQTEEQKATIARQLVSLTSEAKDLRQLMDKVTQAGPWPKSNHPQPLRQDLKMPVSGSVLHGYGSKDAYGVTSQGLTFTALAGSPVVAPRAGRVVFAGPFRGYGQILILQHDGGYHSFLAGFGRIDADMGQMVAKGEPLGVLPTKGTKRPELYFEWRHDGEPIDPMEESANTKSPVAEQNSANR